MLASRQVETCNAIAARLTFTCCRKTWLPLAARALSCRCTVPLPAPAEQMGRTILKTSLTPGLSAFVDCTREKLVKCR